MDYMLTRWAAFTRFLEDGKVCHRPDRATLQESPS
jgi:hypothetical protein